MAGEGCTYSIADQAEVPAAFKGFRNTAAKNLIFVDGGANPTGDACAGHHHGFIGMERRMRA